MPFDAGSGLDLHARAIAPALDRMSTAAQFLEGMARIGTPVDYRNAAGLAAFLAQQQKLLAATVQRIGKVESARRQHGKLRARP